MGTRLPALFTALLGAGGGALAATLLLTATARSPSPGPPYPEILPRLDAVVARLDEVVERLGRAPLRTPPAPSTAPQRERVDPDAGRLTAVADQLSALVATLQGQGARSAFRPPDLRERRAPTRWEALAELASRAEQDHPSTKRELMLRGTADIIALYGFPTDVYSHGSTLQLSYHREGMANAWFNFHDGLLVEFGADNE